MQSKRLYSHTLGRMVPLTVTTTALHAIDDAGGLDQYVLTTNRSKLGSGFPEMLKRKIELAQGSMHARTPAKDDSEPDYAPE